MYGIRTGPRFQNQMANAPLLHSPQAPGPVAVKGLWADMLGKSICLEFGSIQVVDDGMPLTRTKTWFWAQ